MKRFFCIFICWILLFSLCSCSVPNEKSKSDTYFYYRRAEYQFSEQSDSIIVPEKRDISGHGKDLPYILSLYLMGPLSEELKSPFPSYTKLISAEIKNDILTIELTDSTSVMSGSRFSLACGCMALTCMELVDVSAVTIHCGDKIISLHAEDILLQDTKPIETQKGGNK